MAVSFRTQNWHKMSEHAMTAKPEGQNSPFINTVTPMPCGKEPQFYNDLAKLQKFSGKCQQSSGYCGKFHINT